MFDTKLRSNKLNNSVENSLKTLKCNPKIIITRVNIVVQIVVLKKANYVQIRLKLIKYRPYIYIKKDPSSSDPYKIKYVVKSSVIACASFNRSVIPSEFDCVCLYVLPKVQKPYVLFHPVISNVCTTSYKNAKYLVSKFSLLVVNTNQKLK